MGFVLSIAACKKKDKKFKPMGIQWHPLHHKMLIEVDVAWHKPCWCKQLMEKRR
jgi:hypothetical protein